MRADLAAIAIAGVVMFAGFGVLRGLGMVSRGLGGALAAIGLAYMTGLVSVLMIGVVLLVAGIAVNAPMFVALALVIGAGGWAAAVARGGQAGRRSLPPVVRVSRRWDAKAVGVWIRRRPIACVAGIGFVVVTVWGYRWAQVTPLSQWDAWSIWARKGTILFQYGTPNLAFFAAPRYASMHPDYPLLLPLLESIWFRFVGSADTTSLHGQFWAFYVAALGAAAYIASRCSPAKVWAPVVGFVAFVPALTGQLMALYADVPMGLLLMLGVLMLGVWVTEHSRPHLVLATLFLAASADTKNEGLAFAIAALAAALLCAAIWPAAGRRRGEELKALGLSAAAFAAILAPWRLWLGAHHISGDIPITKGIDPAYVLGRTNRISPTLTAVYDQITNQGQWVWLLPMAIGLTLACLLTGRMRRLGSFYALTGIGVFLLIIWVYVIGTDPLSWWLSTSANRTIDGMMYVSAAAILALTGGLLSRERTSHRLRSEDEAAVSSTSPGREHDLAIRS